MNWLTDPTRPKFRPLSPPPADGRDERSEGQAPDGLWIKCPNCGAMVWHRALAKSLYVCPHCGYHIRLNPNQRFRMLFDDGQYQLVDIPAVAADPLEFQDRRRYIDRLQDARDKIKRQDAIAVARGRINGLGTVIAAFDFHFMGGSMGTAVGEGMLAAADEAVAQRAPLIAVTASGGARMQEGALSLMQMPRTIIAVERVKEAGLPYLVVLSDPTTGGVTASFAMLGDIHIAEKGALIGFAGARVIESTVRETLPEGFQRSESLLTHGMVDMVVHRRDLRPTLMRVLDLLLRPNRNTDPKDALPASS